VTNEEPQVACSLTPICASAYVSKTRLGSSVLKFGATLESACFAIGLLVL
jgi:hypothetical protein